MFLSGDFPHVEREEDFTLNNPLVFSVENTHFGSRTEYPTDGRNMKLASTLGIVLYMHNGIEPYIIDQEVYDKLEEDPDSLFAFRSEDEIQSLEKYPPYF